MRIDCMNPATGELRFRYETMSPAALAEALARAEAAQREWRHLPLSARLPLFRELAAVLRREREAWAGLITLEMGKRREESLAEIDKCAWLCEVYADMAPSWLAEESVVADGLRHRIVFQPLGVILSIMPWNFPFWQALRFAVPALVAGNASLLKHARNVPGCAEAIAGAFAAAGFPPGLFQAIFATHADLEALLDAESIRGVSLTGSTEAGALIAAAAGRRLKKVVLELGGSDPFVVLEDAPFEVAVAGARQGRLVCTGQSCIAAKRFIVVAPLAERFAERLAAEFRTLVPGDPADPAVTLGPLVDAAAVEALETQVASSVAGGARPLCGGRRPERPGYCFGATVLADVVPGMAVAEEEVFGPVAPIFSVPDEAAALALANATPFGLGGCVWTRDLARGEAFARRLEAGAVFVNSIVKSDPRMPFGGLKRSGLGRELSAYGLREFVNVQGLNVYAGGS